MLFLLGQRSSGNADQINRVDDVFVCFAHARDATARLENAGLDRLASHAAVHAKEGLRNCSRPLGQFLIAQVAVLLDKATLACKPDEPQKHVRVLIDRADVRRLQHRTDDLFRTKASHREDAPVFLNIEQGHFVVFRMSAGHAKRFGPGDHFDQPAQIAVVRLKIFGKNIQHVAVLMPVNRNVVRGAGRFRLLLRDVCSHVCVGTILRVRHVVDRRDERPAEHETPDSIRDRTVKAAVLLMRNPLGKFLPR